MRNIIKLIEKLESNTVDSLSVLIAISPNDTHEGALTRSEKGKASVEGRTVYCIHTDIPKPNPDCVTSPRRRGGQPTASFGKTRNTSVRRVI